jgi:hypothetical protein
VGAFFRWREAHTLWLRVAWLGAFLELDISLRYRRGWALGVGVILLAWAALPIRARIHEAWLALVLALLPLVLGRAESPAFVALGPVCLLLAHAGGRWVRALTLLVVLASTVLYTSAWPRSWLTVLTDGFRSKAAGALALAAAAVVVLAARAWPVRDPARWRPVVASGALYLVLAVLWSHPLVFRLDTAIAHDAGDPMLNAWILWWNAQAVPFTQTWWDAPFLHPLAGTFTLSETLFGLALFTTPLQWLGLSAVAAYNVAFLLSQPLAAGAAHALGHRLTRRHDAALLGGLAFGFAPYRIAHLAHIQVLWCFAMPLCLLGLHGYLETGRRRWLLLFAGAWLLQGLTNGYFLLYLPILVALWLTWFARGLDPRRLVPIAIASLAVVALVAPVLSVYFSVHARLGLARTIDNIHENSAVLVSWLRASPLSLVSGAGLRAEGTSETWLYPGLAATGLVVAAWARFAWRRTAVPAPGRWPALVVFGCGLALGGLLGRWNAALTLVAVAIGAALVASPALREAWARRSALAFYAAATLCLWILCLGPLVRVEGTGDAVLAGPFALLLHVPGFAGLRSPARFAMPAALCLAVATALAAARLLPRGRRGYAWTAVAAIAIAFEGWISWLPLVPLPPRAPLLEALGSEATAVLELPLGECEDEYAAMYRATFHRLPMVNGFSGHTPPHYYPLSTGLRAHDEGALEAVAETGAVAVLLHHGADLRGQWARVLAASPRARFVRREGSQSLYLLSRPLPPRRTGRPLRIASIRADSNAERVALMRDGDPRTRWHSIRPQEGGEVVEVRLAVEADVEAVVLSLGPYRDDGPRRLAIETSRDGALWHLAWSGSGHAASVRGALQEPRLLPARFDIDVHAASYVRLRQLGSDPLMLWSIAEIEVLGSPAQSAVAREGWHAGHQ